MKWRLLLLNLIVRLIHKLHNFLLAFLLVFKPLKLLYKLISFILKIFVFIFNLFYSVFHTIYNLRLIFYQLVLISFLKLKFSLFYLKCLIRSFLNLIFADIVINIANWVFILKIHCLLIHGHLLVIWIIDSLRFLMAFMHFYVFIDLISDNGYIHQSLIYLSGLSNLFLFNYQLLKRLKFICHFLS